MKKSVLAILLISSLLMLSACDSVGQAGASGYVTVTFNVREGAKTGPPANALLLKAMSPNGRMAGWQPIRNGRASIRLPVYGAGTRYTMVVEQRGTPKQIIQGKYLDLNPAQQGWTHWIVLGPATAVPAACVAHTDCPNGEFCDNGRCIALTPGQCYKQNDCKSGYTCDLTVNSCVQQPAVSCSQTDDANEAVRGTTTGVTAWWDPIPANVNAHTDYCTNVKQGSLTPSGSTGKYVVEYFCDSHPQYPNVPYSAAVFGQDVFAAFKVVDCGPGGCRNGECVGSSTYIKVCTDSDNGQTVNIAGSVTVEEGDPTSAIGTAITTVQDTCKDATTVKEGVCTAQNDAKIVEIACGTNHECKNNACVPIISQACVDHDVQNPMPQTVPSKITMTVTTGGQTSSIDHNDVCVSSTTLLEYYCSNPSTGSQSFVYCPSGCSNGRCI